MSYFIPPIQRLHFFWVVLFKAREIVEFDQDRQPTHESFDESDTLPVTLIEGMDSIQLHNNLDDTIPASQPDDCLYMEVDAEQGEPPASAAPQQETGPEAVLPDQVQQQGTGPKAVRPDQAQQQGTGPKAVRPDQAQQQGTGPEAVCPDQVQQQQGTGPEAVRPDQVQQQQGTGPEAVRPDQVQQQQQGTGPEAVRPDQVQQQGTPHQVSKRDLAAQAILLRPNTVDGFATADDKPKNSCKAPIPTPVRTDAAAPKSYDHSSETAAAVLCPPQGPQGIPTKRKTEDPYLGDQTARPTPTTEAEFKALAAQCREYTMKEDELPAPTPQETLAIFINRLRLSCLPPALEIYPCNTCKP